MLSRTQISSSKKPSDYLLTYGLWLSTTILAVYEISLVRNIVDSIYTRWLLLSGRTAQLKAAFEATTLAQGVTIGMAILAIVIIIGGFEYHSKRVGETKTLKILAWTLGIQTLILILGIVL